MKYQEKLILEKHLNSIIFIYYNKEILSWSGVSNVHDVLFLNR